MDVHSASHTLHKVLDLIPHDVVNVPLSSATQLRQLRQHGRRRHIQHRKPRNFESVSLMFSNNRTFCGVFGTYSAHAGSVKVSAAAYPVSRPSLTRMYRLCTRSGLS